MLLVLEQTLNGLQLGVMLFLMAAGLTLISGIMNFINLAHGSLYMLGAYLCATVAQSTGSFLLGIAVALPGTAVVAMLLEAAALGRLYDRDHLDQVLATFGLILFFNELVKIVWGAQPIFLDAPAWLQGTVELVPGAPYPAYRLAILVVGLLVALGLYLLIAKTRVGMLIRAGASNREMVGALGVDIRRLYTLVFGLGAMLAALAGLMAGPIYAVQVGMGENILILAFVVILVGLVDTLGRAFLPTLLKIAFDPATAGAVGASVASMAIYIFMAAILAWRPTGLFGGHA